MATDTKFDPYYQWLGISPKDRPLNFYRLLGIELFEADEPTIRLAMKRQTTFLKSVAEEEHPQLFQKILSQIEAAGQVLLDNEKRTAYDLKLKAQLFDLQSPQGPPAPPPARNKKSAAPPRQGVEKVPPRGGATKPAIVNAPGAIQVGPDISISDGPSISDSGAHSAPSTEQLRSQAHSRKQKKQQHAILALVAGGVCLVVLGITVAYVMTRGDTPEVANTSDTTERRATVPKEGGQDKQRGEGERTLPGAEQPEGSTTDSNENADGEEETSSEPGDSGIAPTGPLLPGGAGEVERTLKAGITAVEEGRYDDATTFLNDYLSDEIALRKIEAELLLEDVQSARSNRFAIEWLLTIPDEHWRDLAEQVDSGNGGARLLIPIPPPKFEYDTLRKEFEAAYQRNIDRAFKLWKKRDAGEEIEPYLVAIEQLPPDASTHALPDPSGPDGVAEQGEPEPAEPEEPEELGDPTEYLLGKGLVKDGNVWLLQGEGEIAERMKQVFTLSKAVKAAERKLPLQAIHQLAAEKHKIVQAQEMLKKMNQKHKERGFMTASDKAKLESIDKQLDMKIELVAEMELRLAEPMLAATTAQQEYEQGVEETLNFLTEMHTNYTELESNPLVDQALDLLEHRLGPSRNLESSLQRLQKVKETLDEADQKPAVE